MCSHTEPRGFAFELSPPKAAFLNRYLYMKQGTVPFEGWCLGQHSGFGRRAAQWRTESSVVCELGAGAACVWSGTLLVQMSSWGTALGWLWCYKFTKNLPLNTLKGRWALSPALGIGPWQLQHLWRRSCSFIKWRVSVSWLCPGGSFAFSVSWTKPVGLILREWKEGQVLPVGFLLDSTPGTGQPLSKDTGTL